MLERLNERCGRCLYWMDRYNCPKENGIGSEKGGPHCNLPACDKFLINPLMETQPMTPDNPTPPLTAEDIMEKHGLCCDDESLNSIVVDDINKLVTQQTATKDARIAELEERARQAEARNVEYIADFAAERDALQTKLDAANARLAMLQWQPIDTAPKDGEQFLINSGKPYGYAYCTDSEDIEWFYDTYRSRGWTNSLTSLATHWMTLPQSPDQTQTTTEQWLAERDAALLNPWREAVRVLREACMSVLDEKTELALKATEDLK